MKSIWRKFQSEIRLEGDQVATASIGMTSRLVRWLVPFLIVLLTVTAFLPVLENGFVSWDDERILIENPHYRGLGLAQLRWMFTTFHMGHYQPLSWMTFGLDYLLWGMDPFGYHLTSLFLHATNAVLFYFLTVRLLALARPSVGGNLALRGAAAFAALVFAIHPLRVESVAWATERRDVLSGLFFLWTIICYLRYVALSGSDRARLWWMIASVILYGLSLLSKASGITLPLILLVLDVYPFRRLTGSPRKWFEPASRRILWEKLPFLIMALVFGIVALLAQRESGALRLLERYGFTLRLAQALLGVNFYLWKTVFPLKLSPLYETPTYFDPFSAPFLFSALLVVTITTALFAMRRRYPAGLPLWFSYVIILSPVLGIAQSGPQIVADRYSYLSCLGWAMLAGAGLLYCWVLWASQRIRLATFVLVEGLAAAVLIGLGILTWRQTQVWHDSETVWRHAIAVGQESSIAHNNLGNVLSSLGKSEEAIEHYRQALRINPANVKTHYNLGLVLFRLGKSEEAIEHYRQALRINPSHANAHYNLGIALARRGEFEEAIEHYREVLQINPTDAEVHNNLAIALARGGKLEESIKHLHKALELGSSARVRSDTYFYLGTALAKQGHLDQAVEHFQQALKIKPDFVEAYHYLGKVVAAQGDLNKAIDYFRQAIRINPEFAEAHQSLGQALAQQGRGDEAVKHYKEALRILKSQGKASNPR